MSEVSAGPPASLCVVDPCAVSCQCQWQRALPALFQALLLLVDGAVEAGLLPCHACLACLGGMHVLLAGAGAQVAFGFCCRGFEW